MNEATVAATFLVVFREALEASLIIGIVLTVLNRLKAMRYALHVYVSTTAAILASIGLGFLVATMTEAMQGQAEKLIEGVISLVACGILTTMVFWMDRQGRLIKSEIESEIEGALTKKDYWGIISLPFLAVLREGAETVLFLKAISIQSGNVSLWGGVSGIALAVVMVMFIFMCGKKISIRPLFRLTSIFILLIAAGLLAYGIHELEELGWFHPIIYPIWNINSILNEKEGVGSFLKALFGYNGNPSLSEVMVYWSYLFIVFYMLYFKRNRENH